MGMCQISCVIAQMPKPNRPNSTTMAMKIMTTSMLMISALSHPQSKKCLTRASQTMSCIIEAIIPVKKAENIDPNSVPMRMIQMASVNLALSFPTIALPPSHKIGESMMVGTMTFMIRFTSSWSRLSVKVFLHPSID